MSEAFVEWHFGYTFTGRHLKSWDQQELESVLGLTPGSLTAGDSGKFFTSLSFSFRIYRVGVIMHSWRVKRVKM